MHFSNGVQSEIILVLSWGHVIAFARDPVALYEATTLAWDTWTGECLGAQRVSRWRDGAACSTGFPGQCGHLRSFNGPAEDQDRGALHVHTLMFTIAQAPGLADLRRWALALAVWGVCSCGGWVRPTSGPWGRIWGRGLRPRACRVRRIIFSARHRRGWLGAPTTRRNFSRR